MDTQELLQSKIEELKGKNITLEIINGYIADAIELAFIKTISPKIDSLPPEVYGNVVKAVESGNAEELEKLLAADDKDYDLDEKIFSMNLKEALEI